MIKYSMSTAFAVTAIALVCWPAVAAKAESFKAPGVTGILPQRGRRQILADLVSR